MHIQKGFSPILGAALLGAVFSLRAATVLVDGTVATEPVNAGAILDATTTAAPGSFNGNLVLNPSPTGNNLEEEIASGAIPFSSVPKVNRGGTICFGFIFDSAETGGTGTSITVFDVSLDAATQPDLSDAVEIWSNVDEFLLNGSGQNQTDSPQGSGGDLLLLVPASLFSAYTAGDYLNFRVTMRDSGNGPDKWALAPGNDFFAPDAQLPEPSAVLLVVIAATGMLARRLR